MDTWLYTQDTIVLIALVFLVFIIVWDLGFRLGVKLTEGNEKKERSQGQAIEAAILTLFGLLLGFTFSLSASRYELRKETLLNETNAIGTSYLRANLLPAEAQKEMRQILKGYLDARLELYQARFNEPALKIADAKADHFQKAAWDLATSEARRAPTPINGLVVSSLNEMIDLREKQIVSFENLVPQSVLAFLLVLSCLAAGVVGFLNGVTGTRQTVLSLIFFVIVATTLFLVFDFDRPRRGLIRLSHESLIRLRDGIEKNP